VGTGVVYKLGQAFLVADSDVLARHLGLVAVAAIAAFSLVGTNLSSTFTRIANSL